MSDEFFAVILEFNSIELKLGFAGEAQEHIRLTHEDPLWRNMAKFFTFEKKCPSFLNLSSHALDQDRKAEFLNYVSTDASQKDMIESFKADQQDAKFFDWSVDKYNALAKLVKTLIHSSLLISSSKTKLFVLDSGISFYQKFHICEAILNLGAAVSVSFLPYFECAAIAAGVDDCMVVSVQWDNCMLAAVSDLRRVCLEEHEELSGETLHYYQVAEVGVSNFSQMFTENFSSSDSLDRMLAGDSGLVGSIAHIIKGLSIDLRAKAASNIVICGPIADIPGLKGRVLTELAAVLPGYSISGKECLGAWAGASLYCSTSLLKESYTKWTHVELNRLKLGKDIMREGAPLLRYSD